MLSAGIIAKSMDNEALVLKGEDYLLNWKDQLLPLQRTSSRGGEDYFFPDLYRGEGLLDIIVITLALCVFFVLGKSGVFGFDWGLFGQVSLFAMGVALFSALVLTIGEQFLSNSRPGRSALLAAALVMIVVGISAVIAQQAMAFAFPERRYGFSSVYEIILMAVVPVAILLRYLFIQQQARVEELSAKEAGIETHQARIRPHFLFNSMNVIASLIGSDPEKAERAVEDLSDLFRSVLTGSQTLIPLREELSLCRRYLALEKMRLGDRLTAEWQIGDYGDDAKIPCLTLQPVLENAVYHGIQLIQNGGKIDIKIKRTRGRILIDVSNPRNPRIQHNKGRKMAMKNVQYRLKAHFGPTAGVESELMEDHYITHISYPVSG
jgi:two-component system sensor histidine kinase AlgZ